MMQCLVFEKGIPMGPNQTLKSWNPPVDYKPFADKLRFMKNLREWKQPRLWKQGLPSEVDVSMLKRYPCATPCVGDPDPLCPAGAGYFGVVHLEIAEWSEFQTDYRIREAVPCVQQIVDVGSANMVCWPCGRVGVDAAAEKSEEEKKQDRVVAEAH